MRYQERWTPSKFVFRRGHLIASRDPKKVHVSSRLVADLEAAKYQAYIKRYARGKLIDLGCGNVPLYEAYRGYITETVCVDWANSAHLNEHLDLQCDLTAPLPFDDESFDTIILSSVLEHIPVPESLWKEMARILVVDGKLLLNVPFFYWLHEQPHDYYRYTEFALRRFADSADMKVLLLEPIGGVPEILADILSKTLARIPIFGKPSCVALQSTVACLLKTGFGKKVSLKTQRTFPLGYFLVARRIGKQDGDNPKRTVQTKGSLH